MLMTAGRCLDLEDALCSRYRTTKSGCRRCVDLCPVDAIRIAETGIEIKEECIDCGVCVSACPNGAFRMRRGLDDRQLSEDVREALASRPDEPAIRFSCVRCESSADITLSCLSRLTEVLILAAFRSGAHAVEILRPDCSACQLKKAAPHLDRVLEQAKRLCALVKVNEDRLKLLPAPLRETAGKTPSTSSTREKPPLSRREFFKNLGTGTVSMVASTFADLTLNPPPTEAQVFREKISRHPENPKRTHLVEILRGFPEISPLEVCSRDAPIAQIEVEPGCMGCNVCETLCPTGAILRAEKNGSFTLDFKPSLCTNCGICEIACLPRAIRIREKVELALLLEGKKRRLVDSVKRTCKACQAGFLGAESGFCPLCADTGRRQAWLARKWLSGGSP